MSKIEKARRNRKKIELAERRRQTLAEMQPIEARERTEFEHGRDLDAQHDYERRHAWSDVCVR